MDESFCVGVLYEHAEQIEGGKIERLWIADVDVDPDGFGSCLYNREGLWVAVFGDEEVFLLLSGDVVSERHRFCSGGRFVEE